MSEGSGGPLETVACDVDGEETGRHLDYLLTDHLGSVEAVVEQTATPSVQYRWDVREERAFDPWGGCRAPATWKACGTKDVLPKDDGLTRRGFTGHETLAAIGLVHMNGRIYDPALSSALAEAVEKSGANLEPDEANIALGDEELIDLAMDRGVVPTQKQLDRLSHSISTNPEKAIRYAAKIWGIRVDRIGGGIEVIDDGGGPSYEITKGGGRIIFRLESFGDPDMGPGALGSLLFHQVMHDILPAEDLLGLKAHIRIYRLQQALEPHFKPNASHRRSTAGGLRLYEWWLNRPND